MKLDELINMAAQHIGKGEMVSSAQLCLDDARKLRDEGKIGYAWVRALKSLQYSVGMFHADYRKAAL